MNKKLHVKTGDTVIVLSGKDKGRKGQVMAVSPKEGKVIVDNLNVQKKHMKVRKRGQVGGIVKVEAPFYASKVMAVCPKCGKPTKPARKIEPNGEKFRVCKHSDCGAKY